MQNVFDVGYTLAVGIGATFGHGAAQAIGWGMAIADAITPTDTSVAISLLGFDPQAVFLH